MPATTLRDAKPGSVLPQRAAGREMAAERTATADIPRETIAVHVLETLRLAGPISMGHLSHLAMMTATLIMLGSIAPEVLAAGGFALRLAMISMVLCGIVLCVGVLVSEAQGSGDVSQVPSLYWNGLYLSLALSVISFTWMSCAGAVLLHLDQPPDLVADTQRFLDIIRWGEIANLLRLGLMRSILPAFGMARILFVLTPCSLTAYVLLGVGFTKGYFGLPQIGWIGVPIAMVAVSWTGAIVMLIAVHGTACRRLVPLSPPSFRALGAMLRLGGPIGIMQTIDSGFILTISIMMGAMGAPTLAAHQIVQNFGQIAYALAVSCGDAAALRISYRRGARRWHDARTAGTVAFGMSIAAMSAAACALFAFPDFFLGLYINLTDPANATTVRIAQQLMPFACVFVFLDGFYGPGMGSLRGLNDNRFPMLLVGVVYWGVGMPIAYFTTQVWDLGAQGLWYGLNTSLILLSIALTWRYLSRSKTRTAAPAATGNALPSARAELATAALHEVE